MASWRHILFLLSLLGLVSTCAVLGMLLWMTAKIEDVERAKTVALIDLEVSQTSDALRLAVEDYAYWTLAHEVVASQDDDAVFDHLGSGATDSALFDQLFILGPDGDLLYAFDEELGDQGNGLFDQQDFGPLWQALKDSDAADYQSVTALIERQGAFSFVTAAWITPDAITDTPDMPLSTMFGVVHLDEGRLQALISDAQISTAAITEYVSDSVQAPVANQVTIYGLNDAPVAILSWQVRSVGAALRQELLPIVGIVALLIIIICSIAAHYFRTQFAALTRANIVATTDQLTGLLNRAGLAEILKTKQVTQSLENGNLAVIYLDLNKFKALNDRFGHDAGDLALRVTAERLNAAVRKSDIVVRIGGDEFICILTDPDPENAAVSVAQRVLDQAAAPISFGDHEQVVTASVGLAIATPGTQWETVLWQSDVAMYWSKQRHADYPVVYSKSMDSGNHHDGQSALKLVAQNSF